MKKILFPIALLLASNVFAATGTGHAQAELSQPLTVENTQNINFGTISIDPGAGTQTVSLTNSSVVTCPASYSCSGGAHWGLIKVKGAQDQIVNVNMIGSTATLSDGSGNTITLDPWFSTGGDEYTKSLSSISGELNMGIYASITFTGNEVAGTYSSTNAGGSGYTVTVNY